MPFRGPFVSRRAIADEFCRDGIYPGDHRPVVVGFDFDPP
jgi:hypothetical protein